MTDADRYHIPPVGVVDFAQPTRPQAFVDLEPLIRHFEGELTRERNAAVEARYEVSRHRERIVELEAKLKIAETERERSRYLLEHARCDAKDAQQMLMDERAKPSDALAKNAQLERDLAAVREACMWGDFGEAYVPPRAQYAIILRESAFPVVADYIERIGRALTTLTSERAQTPREELTPGSTAAVIEAYRLLVGHAPVQDERGEWLDGPDIEHALPPDWLHFRLYDAAEAMLEWLDEHAPGGKP